MLNFAVLPHAAACQICCSRNSLQHRHVDTGHFAPSATALYL